ESFAGRHPQPHAASIDVAITGMTIPAGLTDKRCVRCARSDSTPREELEAAGRGESVIAEQDLGRPSEEDDSPMSRLPVSGFRFPEWPRRRQGADGTNRKFPPPKSVARELVGKIRTPAPPNITR